MKKSMFLIALMLMGVCIPVGAQDSDDGNDDMYFTPSTSSKRAKKSSKTAMARQPLTVKSGCDDEAGGTSLDYSGKNYSDAEVDAYNRRGRSRGVQLGDTISSDTLYIGDGDEAGQYADAYSDGYYSNDDYYYSSRLARFHEPAVNIYLGYGIPYSWSWSFGWSNPYWWDSYYGWYDPWGWPRYYYGWYSWGWGGPWDYSWAYWNRPWASRGPRHVSAWNGGRYVAGHTNYSQWGSAGGRIWGGGRNYRGAIERQGSRSTVSYSEPTARAFNSYNAGRNSGNMRTRTFGGSRTYDSSSSTSTRSMGGSVPSRSFSGGGSSSPSMGTRSFGGGGGRSFGGGGGGGGRSFGGGRR